MLAINLKELDPTIIIVLIVVVVFAVQLLLCFKARRLWVRLLPAILFSALCFIFIIATLCSKDMNALGYIILSAYTFALAGFCAVAWGIWLIVFAIIKIKRR